MPDKKETTTATKSPTTTTTATATTSNKGTTTTTTPTTTPTATVAASDNASTATKDKKAKKDNTTADAKSNSKDNAMSNANPNTNNATMTKTTTTTTKKASLDTEELEQVEKLAGLEVKVGGKVLIPKDANNNNNNNHKSNHKNAEEESKTVTPHDVLCGRGGATNHHIGNKEYRKVVADHQDEYIVARKTEKVVIAQKIVSIIHAKGGRFLKQMDPETWVYVDDKKAVQKTSQALREGQDVRKQNQLATQGGAAGGGAKRKKPATATGTTSSTKKEKGRDKEGKVKKTTHGASPSSNGMHNQDDNDNDNTEETPKYLDEYTSAELAAVLDAKGPSFKTLANTFREADVPGKLIADLLVEGDAAMDKFLSDEAECNRKILRSSVVASFRLIPLRPEAEGASAMASPTATTAASTAKGGAGGNTTTTTITKPIIKHEDDETTAKPVKQETTEFV
uniref:DUF6824 domain-containing protein n=1 Tax=Amphora coffeiformis TaxID=265554 RepID=A0A7S3P771_9STRA